MQITIELKLLRLLQIHRYFRHFCCRKTFASAAHFLKGLVASKEVQAPAQKNACRPCTEDMRRQQPWRAFWSQKWLSKVLLPYRCLCSMLARIAPDIQQGVLQGLWPDPAVWPGTRTRTSLHNVVKESYACETFD